MDRKIILRFFFNKRAGFGSSTGAEGQYSVRTAGELSKCVWSRVLVFVLRSR